jgi:hypothetical protein
MGSFWRWRDVDDKCSDQYAHGVIVVGTACDWLELLHVKPQWRLLPWLYDWRGVWRDRQHKVLAGFSGAIVAENRGDNFVQYLHPSILDYDRTSGACQRSLFCATTTNQVRKKEWAPPFALSQYCRKR